jgi:hypothetical protein
VIAIDNKLVSDEIVEKQFVCDLNKCKGGCCEDGDAGAPLELKELDELIHNYEIIKPYLTEAGIKAIEQQGKYHYNRDFGWVTPTIKGDMCAYGYKDEKGIIKCGIETAYNEGKLEWKKPISCHLFPIRVKRSEEDKNLEYLNYEPRQDLCKAACKLGKRLQVPVYEFLKEALIRKYGEEFYQTLQAAAMHMENK